MKTKVRLINLTLSAIIAASAWSLLPETRNADAFGIPFCGLLQGSRLANMATNNTICDDPGCEPTQMLTYKKCVPQTSWHCLLEGALQVQCNQNCSLLIPQSDQFCICVPPTLGCPPGTEYNVADCECQPVEEEEEENPECEECDRPSPILISARGNRLELTDWDQGVEFDLNADGFPEQISWTQGEADDAFLALDRNGNGKIDDGTELFGNATPQPASFEPNGFLALAVFDQPSQDGNGDGWISAQDSVFSDLQLWVDSNHDGLSQAGELTPASSSGIGEIRLRYYESRRTDRHGNQFRYSSLVRMKGASQAPSRGPRIKIAVDVFFLGEP